MVNITTVLKVPLMAGLLATTLMVGSAHTTPALARGPEDIANVTEQVIEAVVNISTTQNVEAGRGLNLPNFPQGTPFDDFFEEFMKRMPQGGGQGGQGEKRTRQVNSLGSGFVIDPSGIVITNNHVIKDAEEIFVNFTDGTKLKAEVVGKDPKTDVAVLRVKPSKALKAVKMGDSEKLRIGEWVIAIGNPFGLGGTVTTGIVSARNRDINSGPYDNYIQTDAAINKGNSGGPLFNLNGEVVGINTAIFSTSGGSIGIGFAVPTSMAQPVIEQLQKFGETRRGWLGVRIQPVTEDIAESLGLKSTKGALVAGVDPSGPAKKAGFEAGDLIVRFDGKEIKDARDLSRTVADTAVGKDVDVVIVRKGKEQTKRVSLGRLEEGEQRAEKGAEPSTPSAPVKTTVRGMELAPITAELRKRFNISDKVTRGLVVTRVESNSIAAERRIQAGDVLQEVAQEPVNSASEVQARIDAAQKDGRRTVLLLISNAQGEVRFQPLTVKD